MPQRHTLQYIPSVQNPSPHQPRNNTMGPIHQQFPPQQVYSYANGNIYFSFFFFFNFFTFNYF
jgi:hypothetical protein